MPDILFNPLVFSSPAAVQARGIPLSRNRQAVRGRLTFEQDHGVDLKAEFEIHQVPDKLDHLSGEPAVRAGGDSADPGWCGRVRVTLARGNQLQRTKGKAGVEPMEMRQAVLGIVASQLRRRAFSGICGRRTLRAAVVRILVVAVVGCSKGSAPVFDVGRLGDVRVLRPAGAPSGMVFLFSGSEGWTARDDKEAKRLSDAGALVAGVDLAAYRKALDADDGECLYLLSEIESLSQQIQRSVGAEDYLSPILAGEDEGGTLAAAALTQSPDATVAGVVSVNPTAVLMTRLPLCPGAPADAAAGGGFTYGVQAELPGFWVVAFSADASADAVARIDRLKAAGSPVEIATLRSSPAQASAHELLIRSVEARLSESRQSSSVRSLPLVELRADAPGPYLAIVVSGDGGWRDLDKSISEFLQRRGVSTVGLDALRYFWRSRKPEELAADLASVIDHYCSAWGTSRVVLIGYSFGADVLPFAYNRLDPQTRARVVQISLLGFSTTTDFEVHVAAWLGAGVSADSVPNAAEVERIAPALIQCFMGEEEDDSACPDLEKSGVEVVRTSGGHHFDGDYDALGETVLAGLTRRQPLPTPGGEPR